MLSRRQGPRSVNFTNVISFGVLLKLATMKRTFTEDAGAIAALALAYPVEVPTPTLGAHSRGARRV